jgi:beta-lactamase superfamily II metal-dependent hydrolase
MLLLLLLSSLAYGGTDNTLTVDFIDVGQGDSIYLHASDGTDILIDGGPPSAGPTVVAHLQSRGVDDIEVLVLTHSDPEHEGGLIDVLQSAIPVESWVYNGEPGTTLMYQALISETQARGLTPTPAKAGQVFFWGDVSARVLNPQTALGPDQDDNSVTLLVVYGDARFLFSGDITSQTEQLLLNTAALKAELPAHILKVAHHGSENSSSADFLDAVAPEVAVVSVGANNSSAYPAQETLDRLTAAGAQVYRTDQQSTVVVATDGQTYQVKTSHIVFLPSAKKNFPPIVALRNGGFEADWAEESSHRCLVLPVDGEPYETLLGNVFTPPGWVCWYRHEDDVWGQPEGRDARSREPDRMRSGEKGYVNFTFHRMHDAGLYQQVSIVPGVKLRFTAWAHAWSNHADEEHPDDFPHPDDPGWSEGAGYQQIAWPEGSQPPSEDPQQNARSNFTFWVGIDPTGGTDPLSESTVWSQGWHIYNGYVQPLSVETVTEAYTVTVFLRSQTQWPFRHNDAYWDDALIETLE